MLSSTPVGVLSWFLVETKIWSVVRALTKQPLFNIMLLPPPATFLKPWGGYKLNACGVSLATRCVFAIEAISMDQIIMPLLAGQIHQQGQHGLQRFRMIASGVTVRGYLVIPQLQSGGQRV
ncbi:hypothetical protein F5144DRAFT_582890 [Chaetomium tenue]|uniref:Uncharacterized protein n=1 Tax=Chaetomium tenue TaxID=1854479 RepID=A0ACB7P3R6_9PEZI|nr:hypothetical protein F5144DRAFT_582890 [Chaetomium globosum]